MNSAIIHTLHQRSIGQGQIQGQVLGQAKTEFQNTKIKQSEEQIYVMLLFATFAFLILTTPFYVWAFLRNFYHSDSLWYYAALVFLQSVASAAMYTNCGINFFLYVVSGQKFREDLVELFSCCRGQRNINLQFLVKTDSTGMSSGTDH